MDIKRLKSYDFQCPCCLEPHKRLFEYYAKFHGEIPEGEEFPKDADISMIQRAVMHDQTTFEGSRTIAVDKGVFRCGNCYEYFKFNDETSEPIKLGPEESKSFDKGFKPIIVLKKNAMMNAMASLDGLLNTYGCEYDENTNEIVISYGRGKEIRLDIANQLFEAFYKDNPMFDVKESENWAVVSQPSQE